MVYGKMKSSIFQFMKKPHSILGTNTTSDILEEVEKGRSSNIKVREVIKTFRVIHLVKRLALLKTKRL